MSKIMQKHSYGNLLDLHPEVEGALQDGRAVVALESTIICHGMPYPQNVETAHEVENIVRANGATPATIAILNGRLKVGLTESEIDYLGREGQHIAKASRRDMPMVVSRQKDAATTVASTMIIANMAGIRIFATGGIGGVHRGAELTMDVSADLEELARTSVAVVCAGVKSILDIGRTLEYLETQGVPVIGYQTEALPAFYTRSSGFPVDCTMDNPGDIARTLQAKWDMGIDGGLVIGNPIPKEHSLDPEEIDSAIDAALAEMKLQGFTGKEVTPFLLSRVAEVTKGRSLAANIQLVYNNSQLAAQIAAEFSHLSAGNDG
jgi:pseudouridine-5'-phosphate glycosidase